MLSFYLIWCTLVALGNPFSSVTAFWWSLQWSLNESLTVHPRHVHEVCILIKIQPPFQNFDFFFCVSGG